jgi:transcription termination factor Rho
MAVLTRDALEQSPLADLHLLARELGIDGYRRLRKSELIEALLERQSGADGGTAAETEEEAPKPRRRRGGRRRKAAAEEGSTDEGAGEEAEAEGEADEEETEAEERRRSRRGRRGRGRDREEEAEAEEAEEAEERIVEGTVELLDNGSAFLRINPPEPSEGDVYISAAQVRRCELVTGDTVAGPVRPPRRSERYPSLVRIDTINGRSADEVAEGTPFDELPTAFPDERLPLEGDDPTLQAIRRLTPLGRGSRATIVGPTQAGKTEALRRLAVALKEADGLELTVALAGVRPEEVADWKAAGIEPATVTSFAASPDAQAQALERVVETAKRIAARGGHAVVLIDTLTYVHAQAARRLLALARRIVDGGSLTIIATGAEPVGGETTVIALDRERTAAGTFPALDLRSSGTLRPELLVGDDGAAEIRRAVADARS